MEVIVPRAVDDEGGKGYWVIFAVNAAALGVDVLMLPAEMSRDRGFVGIFGTFFGAALLVLQALACWVPAWAYLQLHPRLFERPRKRLVRVTLAAMAVAIFGQLWSWFSPHDRGHGFSRMNSPARTWYDTSPV